MNTIVLALSLLLVPALAGAQFVGEPELRFAAREASSNHRQLRATGAGDHHTQPEIISPAPPDPLR